MTDADLTDLYATVRANLPNPLIQAMVDMLQRDHLAERELRKLDRQHREMLDGLYGHRVHGLKAVGE